MIVRGLKFVSKQALNIFSPPDGALFSKLTKCISSSKILVRSLRSHVAKLKAACVESLQKSSQNVGRIGCYESSGKLHLFAKSLVHNLNGICKSDTRHNCGKNEFKKITPLEKSSKVAAKNILVSLHIFLNRTKSSFCPLLNQLGLDIPPGSTCLADE